MEKFWVPNESRSAAIEGHPLAGMWLVRRSQVASHGYHFRSVMEISNREANRISWRGGKTSAGDIIADRQVCESWLASEAASKGIKTNGWPPLYFKLLPEPLVNRQENFLFFSIPADIIPEDRITFTREDSFYHLQLLTNVRYSADMPDDLKLGIMTARDVRRMVADGFPERYRANQHNYAASNYIEAQVWGRTSDTTGLHLAATVMDSMGLRLYDKGSVVVGLSGCAR